MCLFFQARRLRKEMADRVPLSDDDFVARIGWPGEDRRPVVWVRHALAKCWKISPGAIYPDDIFQDFAELLMLIGWDELEFSIVLGREIKVSGTDS
jgi:hypothetical protein